MAIREPYVDETAYRRGLLPLAIARLIAPGCDAEFFLSGLAPCFRSRVDAQSGAIIQDQAWRVGRYLSTYVRSSPETALQLLSPLRSGAFGFLSTCRSWVLPCRHVQTHRVQSASPALLGVGTDQPPMRKRRAVYGWFELGRIDFLRSVWSQWFARVRAWTERAWILAIGGGSGHLRDAALPADLQSSRRLMTAFICSRMSSF
jgi:hypothetical protein